MDTFFTFLRKGVVFTIVTMFMVAAVYTPQDWSNIQSAEAGGAGGRATERTQLLNRLQLGAINIASTATAAATSITAAAASSLATKELFLDGIGWAIAKKIVSSMVQSLIDWINSGFQGSPAFLTDLKGFLLNTADEALGGFLQELGGIGSFVCSPFRLDVQTSVAMKYAQSRSNGGQGQPAPTCTLSGVIDNIEGFLQGSFSEGGWNDWFDITAQPEVYTPYGAQLTAEAEARARIINAQGEEMTLLDWSDGFLSGKTCSSASGSGGEQQNCKITKPGKIIQEALTFQLSTGPRSLIEADEINELIAALLGQLAQTALTGINGLLGLSGGTGYTYDGFSSGSYLGDMVDQADDLVASGGGTSSTTGGTGGVVGLMEESLAIQETFRTEAISYIPRLAPQIGDQRAAIAYRFALEVASTTNDTIPQIEDLLTEARATTTSSTRLIQIFNEYQALPTYTEVEMIAAIAEWDEVLALSQ